MARRKIQQPTFEVSLWFRVEGLYGRQDYVLQARSQRDAVSSAWAELHWEALDLGAVDLGERNKAIAYKARVSEGYFPL